MTRPEIEPRSPGQLANTLPTKPMSSIYIYIGFFDLVSFFNSTSNTVGYLMAKQLLENNRNN